MNPANIVSVYTILDIKISTSQGYDFEFSKGVASEIT